jgi:hypothetical protein
MLGLELESLGSQIALLSVPGLVCPVFFLNCRAEPGQERAGRSPARPSGPPVHLPSTCFTPDLGQVGRTLVPTLSWEAVCSTPSWLVHITLHSAALGTGQAAGRFTAPIKPSQASNKQHLIFDDLKGGETLKKTNRAMMGCPRRRRHMRVWCILSIILVACPPPLVSRCWSCNGAWE